MSKLRYLQLMPNQEEYYEIAKGLWMPFILEVNEHEGRDTSKNTIIDGLEKRIGIQGWRKDMHFELAFLEQEAIGIAMFAIDLGTVYGLLENGYGTIMGFYIKPQYRRRGYGTEFYKHIEKTLQTDGATKMYLCPDAVTGVPFWKAEGYTDSGLIDPDDQKPIYIKRL